MLTLTGKLELTVMLMALETAGLPVLQASLEASAQVTTSPVTNALLLYVVLLEPTVVPFTFQV